MKHPLLFLLLLAARALATTPEVGRAEAERLQRILRLAENSPEQALLQASSVAPADRDPLLSRWIGDQLATSGKWLEAVEAYEAGLGKVPGDADLVLSHARACLAADRPARALPPLRRGLDASPREPRLHQALGLAAEATGDLPLAEQAFRLALPLSDDPLPREGLARVLVAQERVQEAEPLLQHLLQQNPARPELWRLHAELALARGQIPTAIARLETADRLRLLDLPGRRRLAELYLSLGRAAEALDRARHEPSPLADPAFRLQLAEALAAAGDTPNASLLLKELPSPFPQPADASRAALVRMRLFLAEDKASDAASIGEAALDADPLHPRLLRLTGEIWLQLDQPLRALPLFERLARQPGQTAQALWLQGIAHARLQDVPRAIELLQQARRLEDLPGLDRALRILQTNLP